jgi:hypothetical protein
LSERENFLCSEKGVVVVVVVVVVVSAEEEVDHF